MSNTLFAILLSAAVPVYEPIGGHGCKPAPQTVAAEAHSAEPSRAVIATARERGDPLEVQGTVFEPDGKTPAAGVVVYVYHTDADGHYARERDAAPRLRAWMVTDAQGRYSYRTIRPASYPRSTIAAHVHTQMWSPRFPQQSGTALEFRDDPFVKAEEIAESDRHGRFAWVATTTRDAQGVLQAKHDLRLSTEGEKFEDNIMHGWRDCPPHLRPDKR